MKHLVILILTGLFVVLCSWQPSQAAVDVGLSIDKDGIKEFHLAIGEHYNVPEKEIIVCRERNIPEEELPVVFFLARHAGVDAAMIIKMRLGGKSWMEITTRLGLSVDIFYVPLSKPAGPPYGNAYGHYHNRHKGKKAKVRFTDVEIIDLVNLNFLSKHYGYSPDEIIRLRGEGKDFVSINSHVKKEKANGKKAQASKSKKKSDSKGKSKGKDAR